MATGVGANTVHTPLTARSGGVLDAPQRGRIIGFAQSDEACAEFVGRFHLGFGLLDRRNLRTTFRATRSHQFGEHFDGGLGGAEAVYQIAKAGRADIGRADQAQPVEPLPVAQPGTGGGVHRFAPIRDSVPASNLAILARCFTITIRLITANNAAIAGKPRI